MGIKMTIPERDPIQIHGRQLIGATFGHSPYISDAGTWMVYDDANGWVDTGIKAKGDAFRYEDFTADQLAALTGPTGPRGETGPQGPQGERGETGPAGPTGSTGPQGIQGIQGIQGEKGEKGEKGDPGKDGTMSFEDLTPEQKATLKGDKGDKGDPGTPEEDSITTAMLQNGAVTKEKLASDISLGSNPYLNMNPWFTVNQRGQSWYEGRTYGWDRWRQQYGVVLEEQADGSVRYTGEWEVRQGLERQLPPGTYTMSILCMNVNAPTIKFALYDGMDGEQVADAWFDGKVPSDWGILSHTFNMSVPFAAAQFGINTGASGSFYVRALKLEYGSVSTLANDHAPDYATELMKGQRYYQKLPTTGYGVITSTGHCQFSLPLTTNMRQSDVSILGNIDNLYAYSPNGVFKFTFSGAWKADTGCVEIVGTCSEYSGESTVCIIPDINCAAIADL